MTNAEIQMSKEIQMTNDETPSPFVIRASSFFRHLTFDIRSSAPSASIAITAQKIPLDRTCPAWIHFRRFGRGFSGRGHEEGKGLPIFGPTAARAFADGDA